MSTLTESRTAKSDLITALNNPHSTVRDIYDFLIDYLASEECFVSALDQRPRMFEAYMTIIDFSRVIPALADFDKPSRARFATSLRETDFTPLAGVLAAYVEGCA